MHRLTNIHGSTYIYSVATQGERRAQTRRRLLDAAAELFAESGVESTSIDAIARRADRTSGAVYDHFGGKDGILLALLDSWVSDVGVVIGAELATARTIDERLTVLWRNVSTPAVGDGRWMTLELELWSHAARNDELREHLTRRYRGAWRGIVASTGDGGEQDPAVGPAVIGLLFGLEMMRRIDPERVTDDMAVTALRGVVDGFSRPMQPTSSNGTSGAVRQVKGNTNAHPDL